MIGLQTVFVLGAGASMDFGFPSGLQLRDKIIGSLENENSQEFKQLGEFAIEGRKEVRVFCNEFRYSGKISIDAFLEHRKEFIPIGKAAIAQALIPFESVDGLFHNSNNWYQYLYKMLNTSFDKFNENKISIVTFNYDRSIEQYLFMVLKSTYGKSYEDVARMVGAIPIIHVHGTLGSLTCLKGGGRPYETALTYSAIKTAQQSIIIIHESIDDVDFKQAHEVLSNAKRIIFIGFGYDETNLTRLRINSIETGIDIMGSCYGFTDMEKRKILRIFDGRIKLGDNSQNALDFLRKNVDW